MVSPTTKSGGLAGEIAGVRDRANSRLNDLAGYRRDSRLVWAIFATSAGTDAGRTSLLNQWMAPSVEATEFPVEFHDGLTELTRRADGYLLNELPTFIIQRLVGIHEEFVAATVGAWLLARPKYLIQEAREGERKPWQRTVEFRRILEETREEIVAEAVAKEVTDLARKGVADQHARLADLLKIGTTWRDSFDTDRLAELAATRNAFVHADGVVGPEYFAKAGRFARADAVGRRLLLPDDYVDASFDRLRRVVEAVADAARTKAGGAPARGCPGSPTPVPAPPHPGKSGIQPREASSRI